MDAPRGLGYAPLASDADPAPLFAAHALAAPAPPSWGPLAADPDALLTRMYRYYCEGGAAALIAARVLNLAALAVAAFFAFLSLLVVRWDALSLPCVKDGTCDIADVALDWRPLARGATPRAVAVLALLAAFALYWLAAAAHAVTDARGAAEVGAVLRERVGLSDATLAAAPWSAVAARVVAAQAAAPLLPDGTVLDEAGIAARILRKDNYLTALIGAGALPLAAPLPFLRSRPALTASLEWNVRALILDAAFPRGGATLSPSFVAHPATLAARCRRAALVNAAAAPFALALLAVVAFMRHAERVYHHPSTAGARAWSRLASARLADYNELPHYVAARLDDAAPAAARYLASFPSPLATHAARFVAFVAGSAAALLLLAALVEDRLLETPLAGRAVVWWVAALGIVLAACRGVSGDGDGEGGGGGGGAAAAAARHHRRPDPNLALLALAAHAHHLPRHWRGRGHTREVAAEVGALFRFRAALFLDEALSVVATPAILYWALPAAAPSICAFFADHTTRVVGVGDVCSLSVFGGGGGGGGAGDGRGAPAPKPAASGGGLGGPLLARSRHGKLAASLLTFAGAYPSWHPDADARRLLALVSARAAAGGVPGLPPGDAAASLAGSLLGRTGGGGGVLAPAPGGWCGAGDGWRGGAFGSADVLSASAAAAAGVTAWPPPADPAAAAACHLALLSLADEAAAGAEDGGEGGGSTSASAPAPEPPRRPSTAWGGGAPPARPRAEAELCTLSPPVGGVLGGEDGGGLGWGAAPALAPRAPPPPPPPRSALAAELAAAATSPPPPPAAFDEPAAWGGSSPGRDTAAAAAAWPADPDAASGWPDAAEDPLADLGDPLADPGLGGGAGEGDNDPWRLE